MKVGFLDVDGHNWPNLCLMKLSTYHKSKGDIVEWYDEKQYYDIVYQSRIFTDTYSKDFGGSVQADIVVKGGTGYNLTSKLPEEIEHSYPDYNLYPQFSDTAYGFLSRGCPRNCGFCIVGEKEGKKAVAVAELSEFWREQKEIKLLDPNLFACTDWKLLLNQLADSGASVDFTQGLDIRLISKEKVELLNKVKTKVLHFAWDNPNEDLLPYFDQFSKLTTVTNYRKRRVYVLCNYNTTHEQDLYRIYALKDRNYDPYVMIYEKPTAPLETIHLQRWANNKIIFRSTNCFDEYEPNYHKKKYAIKKANIEERMDTTMAKKEKDKEKIMETIHKLKTKIAQEQAQLHELEQTIIEMEKTEVHGLLQENNISPDKLKEIIKSFQKGNGEQLINQLELEKENTAKINKEIETKNNEMQTR